MQYVLPLTPADTGSTRRMTTLHLMLAFVLCGIGAGSFVLYWFTFMSPKFTGAYRPFAVLGGCSIVVGLGIATTTIFYKNWLMEGRRNFWLRVAEVIAIGAASLTFALMGQMRPAILFGVVDAAIILAAVWELRKPTAQKAIIDEHGITLPKGSFTQLLRWSEIENVLLRHSILSIELIGNRLVQRSIHEAATFDAASIERFSQNLIRQYEKQRAANAAW
jgi:Trp operon repressor